MNWIKKQNAGTWIMLGSVVLALVALIIYIVNSTTGELAGSEMDMIPIWLTIVSMALLLILFGAGKKLNHWIATIVMLAIVVMLTMCIVLLSFGREAVAINLFIPGMATPGQISCVTVAIVCAAFYVLSIIALIIASFIGNGEKKAA